LPSESRPQGAAPSSGGTRAANVDAVMAEYGDSTGSISGEQFGAFLLAAVGDLESINVMYLLYACGASEFGVLTRAEVERGLAKLGIQGASPAEVSSALSALKAKTEAAERLMQEVHAFVFDVSREKKTSKTIPADLAAQLATGLHGPHPLAAPWAAFLVQQRPADGPKPAVVTKDEWSSLLQFLRRYKDKAALIKDFSEDDAWPLLFDSFVAHLKAANK
jgi:hypothetical protein